MAIGTLYIGHKDYDFSTLNSKWLTKRNLDKSISSADIEDYHTSLEDIAVKINDLEQQLLVHCDSIKVLDFDYNKIIYFDNHSSYIHLVLLLSTKFKNISSGYEDFESDFFSTSTKVRQQRSKNKPLWVAGCSWTSGTGVTKRQRWANILADTIGLEEINLGIGGGSIWDASDQILRADIQKDDIVVWGLTSIGRVEMFSNRTLRSRTVVEVLHNDYYTPEFFFSHIQSMMAIRQIFQVINYCKKIGARLYLINFLDHTWIPFHLKDQSNFLNLCSKQDDETGRYNLIDYGDDDLHPGPLQHQEYAKKISNFIQGE